MNETSASTTRIGSLLKEHVHLYIFIDIYRVWFDLALVDDVLADVVFGEKSISHLVSNLRCFLKCGSVVNLASGRQSHLYTTVCS